MCKFAPPCFTVRFGADRRSFPCSAESVFWGETNLSGWFWGPLCVCSVFFLFFYVGKINLPMCLWFLCGVCVLMHYSCINWPFLCNNLFSYSLLPVAVFISVLVTPFFFPLPDALFIQSPWTISSVTAVRNTCPWYLIHLRTHKNLNLIWTCIVSKPGEWWLLCILIR